MASVEAILAAVSECDEKLSEAMGAADECDDELSAAIGATLEGYGAIARAQGNASSRTLGELIAVAGQGEEKLLQAQQLIELAMADLAKARELGAKYSAMVQS